MQKPTLCDVCSKLWDRATPEKRAEVLQQHRFKKGCAVCGEPPRQVRLVGELREGLDENPSPRPGSQLDRMRRMGVG